MNLVSWLGLAFVVLLTIGGIAVVGSTSREIRRSNMDEDSKRRWGFLMGFSPLAGVYTYKRRNELFGHADENPGDAGGDTDNTAGSRPDSTPKHTPDN